jgi:hypothetical protein
MRSPRRSVNILYSSLIANHHHSCYNVTHQLLEFNKTSWSYCEIIISSFSYRNLDSSVGIATGGRPEFDSRYGLVDFLFSTESRPALESI